MTSQRKYSCVAAAAAALLWGPASAADSVPFWGERKSAPADTALSDLKHGQFVWIGDAVRVGPMVMVVSLDEQRAYVYRNGVLIGATTVSTGRPGHATPTGVFTILQKDKEHRSTIYDAALMPYMQRLTWGGIALHAGGLPGYPESHGCVHLPSEFARLLYDVTPSGMTVVISDRTTVPDQVSHPGYLAPVAAAGGGPLPRSALADAQASRWQPELAPDGPVSMVLSRISGRIVVYRNGVEIGRARVIFTGSDPVGTHALVLSEGAALVTTRFVPDPARLRWLRIGIAGHVGESGSEPDPATAARIEIPEDFVNKVYGVLRPGATLLVTDDAITPATSGAPLDVVNADPPTT